MLSDAATAQRARLEQAGFFHRRGRVFSCELEDYTVDVLLRPARQLVVCFDHAGMAENNPRRTRPGWGFGFVRDRTDKAGIFVKPTRSHWFRPPGLRDLCDRLADAGVFQGYDSVMAYGGSMGGYAALAYADAFRADRVLAMNPQATLSSVLVPWETRFPQGRAQEWDSFPQSAAQGCRTPARVVVAFDRRCAEDAAHVDLLDIPGRIDLNIPFVGHGIPYHLRKMGLLERLFEDVAEGRFDIAEWRRLVRARRDLDDYKARIAARGPLAV
ncbi:MAG: hypothetical protein P1U75_05030 [Antarcticimicrobium sp.]|nr:hypothetical protein [Antarcticimicrobium sp.]